MKLLLRFLQEKSKGLFAHSIYTAIVARKIAETLSLSDPHIENAYFGGLLHDIGKVFTPDSILLKDDKLTEEEYEIMKAHTLKGYDLLNDTSIGEELADIALLHHEQPDGTGYPHQVNFDNVPLTVKIVAVADKYAAMTQQRSYRCEHSPEDAIQMMDHFIIAAFDGSSPVIRTVLQRHADASALKSILPLMQNHDLILSPDAGILQ